MLIKIPRGWERPDSDATSEPLFLSRRNLVKGLGAGSIMAAISPLIAGCDESPAIVTRKPPEPDPSAPFYPVERNLRYTLDRPITSERLVTTYNNYYEFGSSKSIWDKAQALPLRP